MYIENISGTSPLHPLAEEISNEDLYVFCTIKKKITLPYKSHMIPPLQDAVSESLSKVSEYLWDSCWEIWVYTAGLYVFWLIKINPKTKTFTFFTFTQRWMVILRVSTTPTFSRDTCQIYHTFILHVETQLIFTFFCKTKSYQTL